MKVFGVGAPLPGLAEGGEGGGSQDGDWARKGLIPLP